MAKEVTAAIIIIGNEILSGRTQDTNIRYIAQGLAETGVVLGEVRVIPDDEATIIDTVRTLSAAFDYVFTTGGIGPTHDDITAESIAKAFGVKLLRNPEAVRRLLLRIKPEDLNEARLRMANIPEGADLIDNPVSQAPGFRIGNVHVMAGVPSIMQAMFDGIRGTLKGGLPVLSDSVTLFGPEGLIAEGLGRIQDRFPQVALGSYPFSRQGRFGTMIVGRGTDGAAIGQAIAEVEALARGLGVDTEREGDTAA